MGIDFISNFYGYPLEESIRNHEEKWDNVSEMIAGHDGLKGERRLKGLIDWERKRGPRNDTDAARSFVRAYFPKRYNDMFEFIWNLFRHGHIHLYKPKRTRNGIEGQVSFDKHSSMKTKEIEDRWGKWTAEDRRKTQKQDKHLEIDGSVFVIFPLYLFLDFKEALDRFRRDLENSKNVKMRQSFVRAYSRWQTDLVYDRDLN